LEGPKDISKINTAIGLALYGLGLSKVKLSLLPHSIAQKYLWMKRKAYIAASAGLAIFLFVCASVYNVSISRIYNAKMKEMTGEQKTLDFNQQQLVKAQNELNAVKEKMNVCGGLLDARNSWLNMLLDLEIFMPDNMWLTGLSIKGPEEKGKDKKRNILNAVVHQKKTISLRMSGKTTGTYQDIVSLKESLNRSPYFVKDTGIVVSANPPTEGVREFIFDVEAQMVNEYDEE